MSRCPACGDPSDYCQGHGEIGDPESHAILDMHDAGNHAGCMPQSDCQPKAFNDPTVDCCGRDAADCDCSIHEIVAREAGVTVEQVAAVDAARRTSSRPPYGEVGLLIESVLRGVEEDRS